MGSIFILLHILKISLPTIVPFMGTVFRTLLHTSAVDITSLGALSQFHDPCMRRYSVIWACLTTNEYQVNATHNHERSHLTRKNELTKRTETTHAGKDVVKKESSLTIMEIPTDPTSMGNNTETYPQKVIH